MTHQYLALSLLLARYLGTYLSILWKNSMNLKLTYLILLLVMAHSAHAAIKHTPPPPSSQLTWVFPLIALTLIVFALCAYFWLNLDSKRKLTSLLTKKSPVINPPNLQHRHTNKTPYLPSPDSKHSKLSPAEKVMIFTTLSIIILFLMPPIILFGLCLLM